MWRLIMDSNRHERPPMKKYGALRLPNRTITTNTTSTNNITPKSPSSISIPSLIPSFKPPPPDENVKVDVDFVRSDAVFFTDKIDNVHNLSSDSTDEEDEESQDYPEYIVEEAETSEPESSGSDSDREEAEHHHHQEPPEHWRIVPISLILCGIPQNPNFHRHLKQYSELTRKNLAAAWNQTFEDTAKQLEELNMEEEEEDNWARAPDLWKTMAELQEMEYNVLPMRRKLMEMTELREKMKEEELTMEEWTEEALIQGYEKAMIEHKMFNLRIKSTEKDKRIERARNEIDKSIEKIEEYDDAISFLAMKPLMEYY